MIIQGETPSKKNSRINTRYGRSFPSKKYSEWHRNASTQILLQAKDVNICEPIKITMEFTHGDLRRRDSDNGCSSILDLLVDNGILQDDNWQIVQEISIKNNYKKNSSFCKITIDKLNIKDILKT